MKSKAARVLFSISAPASAAAAAATLLPPSSSMGEVRSTGPACGRFSCPCLRSPPGLQQQQRQQQAQQQAQQQQQQEQQEEASPSSSSMASVRSTGSKRGRFSCFSSRRPSSRMFSFSSADDRRLRKQLKRG